MQVAMHENTLRSNMQIVAKHIIAENSHQMDATLATLHPDCVFEDIALGQIFRGREGASQYYRMWWDAFAVEVQGSVIHWTTEGQLVAEACYVGRHTGRFLGIEPTGQPLSLRFAVFVDFRDALMAGERFYYNLGSLAEQLGVTHLPTFA
jgi:steroid delta-isomerase-like uncharacterized protein